MTRAILNDVRFAGLSVVVPRRVVDNLVVPSEELAMRERLVRNIGIRFRRVATANQIFSDLAEASVNDLVDGLGWEKSTIDALIFVTQTPEHPIPSNAIISQHRLGLPKTTLAFDINLGCSGYPYGLFIAGSMMRKNGIKRAICVIGDQAASEGAPDSGREILFGDAASATALEYDVTAPPIYFEGFSDGEGYKSIYIPGGGRRMPLTKENIGLVTGEDGVVRSINDVWLDGPAIVNFSIEVVPQALQSMMEFSGMSLENLDSITFHQANNMINSTIRKKLRIPTDKIADSLYDFGNTSSASIPVSLVHKHRDKVIKSGHKLLFCGFGIGLSWATLLIETTPNIYCSEILEI